MTSLGTDLTLDNLAFKALVIGDAGTGKTTFLSTWPDVWIADFDGGLLSIRGKDFSYDTYSDTEIKAGSVEMIAMPSAFERFISDFKKRLEDAETRTIGVDGLTGLGNSLMAEVQTMNHSYGKPASWPEYAVFGQRMVRFLNLVKHAKKHIILTAHPDLVKNDVTGALFVGPSVIGKASVPPLKQVFDEIYIAKVKKLEGKLAYVLQTVGDEYCCAKSRLASTMHLLAEEEAPDYASLVAKLVPKEGKGP